MRRAAAAPAATHTNGKTIEGRFDVGGHKVAGSIGGKQLVTDLHTLLRKAGVKAPYVLLGASFGGVVAYAYAATYPQQVKGMPLLEAGFPTELKLEPLFPEKDRLTHDWWKGRVEQIDVLDVYEYANSVAPPRRRSRSPTCSRSRRRGWASRRPTTP